MAFDHGCHCFQKTNRGPAYGGDTRNNITRRTRVSPCFCLSGARVQRTDDERTFDLAQERLQDNKKFSPRRTVDPSILQGLAHCAQCGYQWEIGNFRLPKLDVDVWTTES